MKNKSFEMHDQNIMWALSSFMRLTKTVCRDSSSDFEKVDCGVVCWIQIYANEMQIA